MDWVKQKVAQLKERESRSQKKREWVLHNEAAFPAKAQKVWERLEHCLEECVDAFNDEFPTDLDRHFQFSGRHTQQVTIRRIVLPEVRVTATLKLTGRTVDYELCVTRTAESDPQVKRERFNLYTADSGDLYLVDSKGSPVGCDEAARIILEPVFSLM